MYILSLVEFTPEKAVIAYAPDATLIRKGISDDRVVVKQGDVTVTPLQYYKRLRVDYCDREMIVVYIEDKDTGKLYETLGFYSVKETQGKRTVYRVESESDCHITDESHTTVWCETLV